MRKLGISSEKRPPETDAIKAYNDIFNSLLGSVHRKAFMALFTMHYPQPTVEIEDIKP
jgi:hypothetical protein